MFYTKLFVRSIIRSSLAYALAGGAVVSEDFLDFGTGVPADCEPYVVVVVGLHRFNNLGG